jgi:hypothetical protein
MRSRMFDYNPKVAKKVLITGINRGLGVALAKMLTNMNYEIFATARPEKIANFGILQDREGFAVKSCMGWDLLSQPNAQKIDEILAMVPGDLHAVIHCASPYSRTLLTDTSREELMQYSNVICNDTIFLQAVANRMKQQHICSVLAITGSVIGLPHIDYRGMIGLVKSHQRQLAGVLDFESNPARGEEKLLHIRHFNLGSFRENSAVLQEPEQFIPEEFVAEVIVNSLEYPEKYELHTHLVSKSDEKKYGVNASITPPPLTNPVHGYSDANFQK